MAHLFVSPTKAEAFGLVLLESMACGTPVVAFDVGGVPDLVRPGRRGYLAEAQSAEDLARGISTLLDDRELRADGSTTAGRSPSDFGELKGAYRAADTTQAGRLSHQK